MTELYAAVNGIKICYEIHGEGEPIILVHGWGGSKDGWFVQVGALSKYFKVIIFDNRGAGKSSKPNDPYTMDIYADDINGLLEFLNIEKTHLLGESLGGMIALNFILKYPERVNKFILINSWPGFPNEQGPEIYSKGKIVYFEELKKDPLNAFLNAAKASYSREFFKMMKENPKKRFFDLWSVDDLVKIDLANPSTPADNNNAANAVKGHNVTDRLHEIRSPTLLICGEKDRIATLSVQRKIHEQIPNSIFKVIKEARHGVSKEKAPEVNEAIINFLKN